MIAHRHRRRSALIVCAVFICAALAARQPSAPSFADEQKNLLLNADFAKGSEDQPDSWRTEAWINSPEAFQTHWHQYSDKPSEMEVDNLQGQRRALDAAADACAGMVSAERRYPH